MAELLCNRRIFGRRTNRVTVRLFEPDCAKAGRSFGSGGRGRVRHADHCSFRCRTRAFGDFERSLGNGGRSVGRRRVTGLCGVVYALIVLRRMRSQPSYRPEFEDWLFHLVLPLVAYLALAVAAFLARFEPGIALFAVAGSALLLLFVGIHNTWDAVTYHVFVLRR